MNSTGLGRKILELAIAGTILLFVFSCSDSHAPKEPLQAANSGSRPRISAEVKAEPGAQESTIRNPHLLQARKGYICPNHCDKGVVFEKPGTCPKCGANLKPNFPEPRPVKGKFR